MESESVTTGEVKDGRGSPQEEVSMQTITACLWGYLTECVLSRTVYSVLQANMLTSTT